MATGNLIGASAGAQGTFYVARSDGKEEPRAVTAEGLLIGRPSPGAEPAPDIALAADGTGSRRHARIFIDGGVCMIEDLGSRNGTFVGGERIEGRRRLQAGDRIVVGEQELVISSRPTPEAKRQGASDPGRTRGETVFQKRYGGVLPAPAKAPEPAVYTGRPLRIGRDPSNELVLDSPTVSRFHAVIEPGPDGPGLCDLGSRNGTRLDGQAIRAAPLAPGAEIGIGPFKLTFTGTEVRPRNERGTVSVEAIGVRVAPKGRQILASTYLKIRPGELVAIIGENGAGKTTLLKALAGETPLDGGEVLINGEPVSQRRSDLGFVPQDDAVHPLLTVEEALSFGARLRLPELSRQEIERAVDRVAGALGLDERPQPDEPPLRERQIGSDESAAQGRLSGGQRKRACVAMEMLSDPSVVFLDEPTSPLDPLYAEELVKLLRGLAASACAVVMVTHKPDDLELCDKVAVMARGGYLCFYGPPTEALEFFCVQRLRDIYGALGRRSGEEWSKVAGGEVAQLRAEGASRSAPPRAGRSPQARPPGGLAALLGTEGARMRAQIKVLARRYALLLRRDRRNLLGLTLSIPVIALLLLALPSDVLSNSNTAAIRGPTFVFVLVFIVILLAVIASYREIVKERLIYLRERAIGVDPRAYTASKLIVLGGVGASQALALGALAFLTHHMHSGAYLGALVVLVLAAWCGIGIGLAISTVVRSQEQATTLIAVPLILQLLLAGTIVPLSSVRVPAALMPSRWAFAALGHLADLYQVVPATSQYANVFDHSAILYMFYLLLFVVACACFTAWRTARIPA